LLPVGITNQGVIMSLILKAAFFGGLAYVVTRALRNPNTREALSSGLSSFREPSYAGGSMRPEHHPDETMWPASPQQSNTGPSS
jgi:hypothetical protein